MEGLQVSSSSLNWRIYQLVKDKIITRLGRGHYTVSAVTSFQMPLEERETKLGKQLKEQFPFIRFCIWNSNIIKSLSQHQSFVDFLVIETERDVAEAVFHFLKEENSKVYLKPNRDIVETYLLEMSDVTIVQNLVSEAPLANVKGIPTTTIEKLLVDLAHHNSIFYFYQGYELMHIFQNAFEKYAVNTSKLLRYANRRKIKTEILDILKTINRH